MSTRVLDEASIKQTLWHSMRADLAKYAPEVEHSDKLMCPTCARQLPLNDFSLEHIIPKQALSHDPEEVRAALTINQRSGNILLCKKRLKLREKVFSENGCNGWKGRYYDTPIREALTGLAMTGKSIRTTETHLIAIIGAAYLALVRKFGYQIALTPSGVLLRHQFFMPRQFRPDLPLSSQMVLGGPMPEYSSDHLHLWGEPFRVTFDQGSCVVIFRTLAVRLPLSRNPQEPLAMRLRITPQKYKMRPDFRTAFD